MLELLKRAWQLKDRITNKVDFYATLFVVCVLMLGLSELGIKYMDYKWVEAKRAREELDRTVHRELEAILEAQKNQANDIHEIRGFIFQMKLSKAKHKERKLIAESPAEAKLRAAREHFKEDWTEIGEVPLSLAKYQKPTQ